MMGHVRRRRLTPRQRRLLEIVRSFGLQGATKREIRFARGAMGRRKRAETMKHGESDGRLMGQTQDWIRTERLRILRAARDGRLRINHHGRYVIDGERRPDRKQREYLLHRRGAITWPEYGDAEQKVRLRASGESLLAQLDSRDLGVSWAKEGVALAGVKSGDIVPGGSEGPALLRARDRAT